MDKLKMTVLLTGATGFLGSHILKKLLEIGYHIVILKRTSSDTWRIKKILPKVISYDIDIVPFELPFEENKIDVVIHTVTSYGRNFESVESILNTNLIFSIKLLESAVANGVHTFLNTDTFFNTNNISYSFLNHYSLSKRQFVEWLQYFNNRIQVINLKLEHIYGPQDDDTKFVSWVLNQLFQNVSEMKLTEGMQKRDFIYVDDVVDVYMLMLVRYKEFPSFTSFNVGTGNSIRVKDFIENIYSQIQEIQEVTTKLRYGAIPYRKNENMNISTDIAKLKKLGWNPKYSIAKGIEKTIKEKRT